MRGGLKRGVRVVVVVVVLSVIWLQLALPPLPHDPRNAPESMEPDPALKGGHITPLQQLIKAISGSHNSSPSIPLSTSQIWEIWEQIVEHSGSEVIYNLEMFGPIQPNTVVIVVQVHNRLDYLRHLIVSLAEVRNIESVLLIFSHDYFDEKINKLITTIDFCKVMQVFYPHPLQLHPSGFPGPSEGDCPRDANPAIVEQLQCKGNPDLYGHYREPRYTQTKHHWWWKANKVFDSVLGTLNHTGYVLFLEEDHYVSEDLLHMLTLLAAALPHACPHCSMLTLGNYLKNYNWANDAKKVELSPWLSSRHNMGFAFNRSTWLKMKECGEGFCTHDDYNWDWSLQQVSNTCLRNRLYTMVLRAPRVFHIGECGVHHKKKDCSSKLVLNKVYRTLRMARRALYPLKLIIVHAVTKKLKKHKGNGGWGDHRDQELCKSFSTSSGPYNSLVLEPRSPASPLPAEGIGDTSLAPGNSTKVLGLPARNSSHTAKPRIFPAIHPKESSLQLLWKGSNNKADVPIPASFVEMKPKMSVSHYDPIGKEKLSNEDVLVKMFGRKISEEVLPEDDNGEKQKMIMVKNNSNVSNEKRDFSVLSAKLPPTKILPKYNFSQNAVKKMDSPEGDQMQSQRMKSLPNVYSKLPAYRNRAELPLLVTDRRTHRKSVSS